jgi:N-carbamoylputrescine amidase
MGGNKIKIALIQAKVKDELNANMEKAAKFIREAAEKGSDIVCLQELFSIKYPAQKENRGLFSLAEEIPGKLTNFLSKTAKENKVSLINGSLFEKSRDKYFNTALIFDKGGKIICKYRKVHIPQDPYYHEKFYFSSGDLGFVQAKTEKITIAPLICYDQWYPEAARINALKGAQMIFYPTAIGWFDELKEKEPWSLKRWQNVMCAHASANGIYVAAANRVGTEDSLEFWGSSFIADPYGEIIAQASDSKEGLLTAEIDLDKVRSSQEGWMFLKNRQPKDYSELIK